MKPDYDEAEQQVRLANEAMIWLDAHRPFFQPETMSMVSREHIAKAMAAFTAECIKDLAKVLVKEYRQLNDVPSLQPKHN